MQYQMLIMAAMLLAVEFVFNKFYQQLKGTSARAGFGFNALLGLFQAIVFFGINGFTVHFSAYSLLMATLSSCFVMGYNLIGFRLLKSGTMALYTLFLMTGGMTIPYLVGLVFLDEPFTIPRVLGLVLILCGVVLSNFSRQKIKCAQIFMCITVFVLNGLVSVVSKLHQIETGFSTVNATEFIILSGIIKFILAGIIYLCIRGKHAFTYVLPSTESSLRAFLLTLGAAVVGGVSYLLQLYGAASLPGTVLYPFITGGSIVFSALAGRIVLKEKLSPKIIGSIMFCFLGTILFF